MSPTGPRSDRSVLGHLRIAPIPRFGSRGTQTLGALPSEGHSLNFGGISPKLMVGTDYLVDFFQAGCIEKWWA